MKSFRKRILPLLLCVAINLNLTACGGSTSTEGSDKTISAENILVFDALQYQIVDGANITEAELIEQFGEPDEISDWNYEISGKSYPIRTLYYGNYEYSFNNDSLQRVTIWDTIPYSSKGDFLAMFNLQKYSDTSIKDTGSAYRAYNCGVNDLWLTYDEENITMVKISYGDIFS